MSRPRRRGRDINGVLLLDKPQGMSSNDALQKVKRIYNANRAGHTGALDPLATGMLPICLGEATKFSQYLLDSDKRYRVIARLGQRTDTSDADGQIVEERPVTFSAEQLAAALDTLPDLAERRFVCRQYLSVGADTVTCTGYHGEQTVEQALANSCNCAFGELALELGGERLAEYAKKLGLSGSLELDGMTTAAGRFDLAEGANLAWSGIGQHKNLATPYAVARMCAAIANGGTVKEPTLLKDGKTDETKILTPETAVALGEMMNYTVAYAYGQNRFPGLDLCAKSGTAEIGDGASHAWFAGYLQSGPPLAFAVVIERGGGGLAQAGAAANAILQTASEMYGQ